MSEQNDILRIENVETQMRKGLLEYCILHIISRNENYVHNIFKDMHAAGLVTVEGTLYPLISRLRKVEYVQYRWHESSKGPPRKYYALTDKGQAFLDQLHKSWNNLSQAVNLLITDTDEPIDSTTK